MELIPVESSMIRSAGYDATTEELEVVFQTGAVWRYRGVPRPVFDELLAALSKGQYMNGAVIGVYPEYQVKRQP